MTAEQWIDENGDKAARRYASDGICLWEESEVCEIMGKYALAIAEKAVGEERKNWGDKNPIGGALNNVLSRIKTEIGGE